MTAAGQSVARDKPLCGATTRSEEAGGGPCRRPAGWGTDHVGEGRCKLHGGCNRVKHGRYSTVKSTALRALIEQHSQDPEPLDLEQDLLVARALFQRFLDRHGDEGPDRETEGAVLSEATKLLEACSRIAERIAKREADNAVSRKDLLRVLDEMGRVVRTLCPPDLAAEISKQWLQIRL